jgi:hypothetical protein
VPFLRFARDKRGYEHFYLVHTTTRRGKSRSRILYWFRSPPGVKIGRPPFDESMRRALEAQYPEIAFDWQQLIDTPIPPPTPDVERWRERRRLERAAKQAAAAEAAADSEQPASETGEPSEPAVAEETTPTVTIATDAAAMEPAVKRRRRRGGRGRSGSGVPVDAGSGQGQESASPSMGESTPAPAVADGSDGGEE